MSNELVQHDFPRGTIVSTYKERIYYKGRTQFTGIECRCCYSCHWKKEELDKVELERANSQIVWKYPQLTAIRIEQPSEEKLALDVYGQQIELICNHEICNHRCKCRHPINYATRVSISQLTGTKVL